MCILCRLQAGYCQAFILWVYTRAANLPCAVLLQRCADMQHSEVRIVKGVDDRLTGEAYVHISGARAKLRLALAKDRTLMPVRYSLPPNVALAAAVLAAVIFNHSGGCLESVLTSRGHTPLFALICSKE